MDPILLKRCRELKFVGPRKALLTCFVHQVFSENPGFSKQIQTWRHRRLKDHRFLRQAALFCYGMKSVASDCRWGFAMWEEEQSELDAIFQCFCPWDKQENYKAIQLKELVPHDVNASASLQGLLDKIDNKYPKSEDLAVGIYVNRDGEMDLGKIVRPKSYSGQIWLFGATDRSGSRHYLIGDLMQQPRRFCFEQPTFNSGESIIGWKSANDYE